MRNRFAFPYKATRLVTTSGSGDDMTGNGDAIIVRASWLMRATVRIVPGAPGREMHLTHGGVVWRRLIDTIGIARNVTTCLNRLPNSTALSRWVTSSNLTD